MRVDGGVYGKDISAENLFRQSDTDDIQIFKIGYSHPAGKSDLLLVPQLVSMVSNNSPSPSDVIVDEHTRSG